MARPTFLGFLEYQTMDVERYFIRFTNVRMLPPFPFSGGPEVWMHAHLYHGVGVINLTLFGGDRVEYLTVQRPAVTRASLVTDDPIEDWD